MLRSLVVLLDLLTNYQGLETLASWVFTFGMANTGLACFLGGVEIIRRLKLRSTNAAPSRFA